jgi:hypothetical protein
VSAEAHWTEIPLSRSQLPRLLREGDAIPPRGWAVEAFAQVFHHGQPAGLFVTLTIARDGQSVLRFENIGEGRPSARELLS